MANGNVPDTFRSSSSHLRPNRRGETQGISAGSDSPSIRCAEAHIAIRYEDFFPPFLSERRIALVGHHADDLQPFGFRCAEARQNALADSRFVREGFAGK